MSMVKRLVGCGVATGAGVPTTTRSRVIGMQVIEGLGRHQLVDALVVLLAGQPALGVRGAEQGGHLVAVGVGGTQIATSDRADIRGFGHGLGHPPKLVRRPSERGGAIGAFRAGSGNSGSSLTAGAGRG